MIISRAHDVVQANPPEGLRGLLVCVRCGLRGPGSALFSDDPAKRCNPHGEADKSGWRPE